MCYVAQNGATVTGQVTLTIVPKSKYVNGVISCNVNVLLCNRHSKVKLHQNNFFPIII